MKKSIIFLLLISIFFECKPYSVMDFLRNIFWFKTIKTEEKLYKVRSSTYEFDSEITITPEVTATKIKAAPRLIKDNCNNLYYQKNLTVPQQLSYKKFIPTNKKIDTTGSPDATLLTNLYTCEEVKTNGPTECKYTESVFELKEYTKTKSQFFTLEKLAFVSLAVATYFLAPSFGNAKNKTNI